jgi:hypothetical protein
MIIYMITQADIQLTKTDLVLGSTILIVSNIVRNQLEGTELFNEKWMNLAVATLLGFALHGLLTNKVSSTIKSHINVAHMGINQSIYDIVRFGTVFVSQKMVTSYIEGKPIVFDQRWAMTSGLTLAGFTVFNMLIKGLVPNIGNQQPLVNDLIKISMGALLATYVVDGTVNMSHLLGLASTLAGFVVFHLVTKRLVVPKEKFNESGGFSVMH